MGKQLYRITGRDRSVVCLFPEVYIKKAKIMAIIAL